MVPMPRSFPLLTFHYPLSTFHFLLSTFLLLCPLPHHTHTNHHHARLNVSWGVCVCGTSSTDWVVMTPQAGRRKPVAVAVAVAVGNGWGWVLRHQSTP